MYEIRNVDKNCDTAKLDHALGALRKNSGQPKGIVRDRYKEKYGRPIDFSKLTLIDHLSRDLYEDVVEGTRCVCKAHLKAQAYIFYDENTNEEIAIGETCAVGLFSADKDYLIQLRNQIIMHPELADSPVIYRYEDLLDSRMTIPVAKAFGVMREFVNNVLVPRLDELIEQDLDNKALASKPFTAEERKMIIIGDYELVYLKQLYIDHPFLLPNNVQDVMRHQLGLGKALDNSMKWYYPNEVNVSAAQYYYNFKKAEKLVKLNITEAIELVGRNRALQIAAATIPKKADRAKKMLEQGADEAFVRLVFGEQLLKNATFHPYEHKSYTVEYLTNYGLSEAYARTISTKLQHFIDNGTFSPFDDLNEHLSTIDLWNTNYNNRAKTQAEAKRKQAEAQRKQAEQEAEAQRQRDEQARIQRERMLEQRRIAREKLRIEQAKTTLKKAKTHIKRIQGEYDIKEETVMRYVHTILESGLYDKEELAELLVENDLGWHQPLAYLGYHTLPRMYWKL